MDWLKEIKSLCIDLNIIQLLRRQSYLNLYHKSNIASLFEALFHAL